MSKITEVTVNEQASVRALVTVRGNHTVQDGGNHEDWLPFVLRFYLYANSDSIRLVHSLVFDGAANEDLITGVGIRFSVPLEGEEQYDRHVRFAGVDGGLISEAVQGITGLRRDPGAVVRTAQVDGDVLPDTSTWDVRVSSRLRWIPTWGDYSLSQLSSDGFTLKKRTKAGQSWVSVGGGTRSGGLAYLGGATKVGLFCFQFSVGREPLANSPSTNPCIGRSRSRTTRFLEALSQRSGHLKSSLRYR